MTKLINILLSILLIIITVSFNDAINNFDSLENETKVVLKIKNQFDTIEANRKKNIQTDDVFDINDVKMEPDVLKINLSYTGGCTQHNFEIL